MKKLFVTLVCLAFLASASRATAGVETTVTVHAHDSVALAGPIAEATLSPIPEWFAGVFPANALNLFHDAYLHETFPVEIDLAGFGDLLTISAEGEWDNNLPGLGDPSGPDGNGNVMNTHAIYTAYGVSRIRADLNTLVGLFTTDLGPIPFFPPDMLEEGVDDMTNPELNQTFAINSLLEGIHVPDGATTLWLGMHTHRAWNRGVGSVEVTVQAVPEPGSLIVWGLLSMCGVAAYRRRRANTSHTAPSHEADATALAA